MNDRAEEIVEERESSAIVALIASLLGAAGLAWVPAAPAVVALGLLAMALGTWAAARGERHVMASVAVGIGVAELLALLTLTVTR